MKYCLLSIILLSFIFSNILPAFSGSQSAWNNSMYSQYDYKTFSKYGPANKKINFKSIDNSLLNAAIFYATNRERVNATTASPDKGGDPLYLEPFKYSYYLTRSAQLHATDMVKQDFFDHENPYDESKKTPFDRMAMFNITDGYMAENISYLQAIVFGPDGTYTRIDNIISNPDTGNPLPPHTYNSLAKDVLNQWMHSPPHKENILNENLTYLGCGAAFYYDKTQDNLPTFKCVQNFGSIVPNNP